MLTPVEFSILHSTDVMDFNTLLTVALIWGLAAITPGPNFFITIHTAVGGTRSLSLFTVFGIVVGTLVWTVAGFFGVSILFQAVPMLYFTLKLLGGFYLVYVGARLIFSNSGQQTHSSENNASAWRCFRLGLLTNLLNPKTAAFMTSLFAATIPANSTPELGLLYSVVICAISAIWYTLVALLFSHNRAKGFYERQRRKIERMAGTIFIGFGLKLALSR